MNYKTIVVALLALAAQPALAEDPMCQREAAALVGRLASTVLPSFAPCYGARDENHPLSKKIGGLIDQTPTPASFSTALQELAQEVQAGSTYGDQAARDKYASLARDAALQIQNGAPPGNEALKVVSWELQGGTTHALPDVNVISMLDASCPMGADITQDPCKKALDTSRSWLRIVLLTERTLMAYSGPAFDAVLARSTARLAMWHSYRDDGLPQYPWEWFLNSWRLNRADKDKDNPLARPRDSAGQPMGPYRVPTDQIILLHPGVGLEYRDKPDQAGAEDDSKTAPIIYLEIIGRNRWSWNEKTGAMIGGSGISLVATYANREQDTEVGYGLLFHSRRTKAYTLGITRSGDSTNIIFNADVAEFFKDKLGYWNGVAERAKEGVTP